MPAEPAGDARQGRHAVVLAAGQGRRFGGGKLLAPLRGRPLIAHAIEAACAAPVETVTVVTGFDGERVARAVSEHAPGPVRILFAADHAEGMGASLRAAAGDLPAGVRAVLVFLGDMPAVPHDLADRLLAEIDAGAVTAAPWRRGRRGHPVAFGAGALDALGRLGGDRGARDLFALAGRHAEVETDDPGVLFDIDRPTDLASA